MKPKVTILMTSNGRHPYMDDAIQSVMNQTMQDFELVIIDSGRMRADKYELYGHMPKIKLFLTGEYEGMINDKCMVSYVFNEAYKEGYIRGEYFCTFYDDDIYYPTFLEKMAGYLDARPEHNWVRCTERRVVINRDGSEVETPALKADHIMTANYGFDCVVDGMQVMYRTDILSQVPAPLMDENPDISSCSHSDGIFFEKVKTYYKDMGFIEEALCEHHNTPVSTYTPSQ